MTDWFRDIRVPDRVVAVVFAALALMSVIGVRIMGTYGDNLVLIAFLIIAPILVSYCYLSRTKRDYIYFVCLFFFSLGLLLSHSLMSSYPNGMDVHSEVNAIRDVLLIGKWDPLLPLRPTADASAYVGYLGLGHVDEFLGYLGALSITVFPSMFCRIVGVDVLQYVKIAYPFLLSFLPPFLFVYFRRVVDSRSAFMASALFVSQITFVFNLQSATRQGLALIFMSLFVNIAIIRKLGWRGVILATVFGFMTIGSHYTTAVIMLIILTIGAAISRLGGRSSNTLSLTVVLFLWILAYVYQFFLTQTWMTVLNFARQIYESLGQLLGFELRRYQAQVTLIPTGAVANALRAAVDDVVVILITIGVLNWEKQMLQAKSANTYKVMAVSAWVLLIVTLVLPYVGAYGPGRFFQEGLIFLAPAFVTGSVVVSNVLFRSRAKRSRIFAVIVILVLFNARFACALFLTDQFLGTPYSMDLNRTGDWYAHNYIHEAEIASANLLEEKYGFNYPIHGDFYANIRLLEGSRPERLLLPDFTGSESDIVGRDGYIYLRYENIVLGRWAYWISDSDIGRYQPEFSTMNTIISNGYSSVLLPPDVAPG